MPGLIALLFLPLGLTTALPNQVGFASGNKRTPGSSSSFDRFLNAPTYEVVGVGSHAASYLQAGHALVFDTELSAVKDAVSSAFIHVINNVGRPTLLMT